MKKLNRRIFLQQSTLGAGAAIALSQLPSELFAAAKKNNVPLGFQTWSVREKISKDFPAAMKMMADLGYKITEMCSPKSYAGAGFGALVKEKYSDIKKMITDAGLSCPSCHFGFKELTDGVDLDDRIEFAHALGMTQMICSSFGLPEKATLNDYSMACDKLNKAGEQIQKSGLQAGYHNHDMEFHMVEDKLLYEELLKRFDPTLIKMQFQTEVINQGYKAATYFNKYPGRFISSHLSDWTSDKKEIGIGSGVIDWKEFFAAAKTGGVKNFFVEMEAGEELDKFKNSIAYIHSI